MNVDDIFQNILDDVEKDTGYTEQIETDIESNKLKKEDLQNLLSKITNLRNNLFKFLEEIELKRSRLSIEASECSSNFKKLERYDVEKLTEIKRLLKKLMDYNKSPYFKQYATKCIKEIINLVSASIEDTFLNDLSVIRKKKQQEERKLEQIGDLYDLELGYYYYYEKYKGLSSRIFMITDQISNASFYINYLTDILDEIENKDIQNNNNKKH